MADEKSAEDQQHIEEILTDLDTILSDLTQTDAGAAAMVQIPPPKPEASSVIPPPPAAAPPKPAPVAAPVIKPVPAPTPAQQIPYPKPLPGAIVAATPAVPPPKPPSSIPATPKPAMPPAPIDKPTPAPSPAPPPSLIERFPEPAKGADLKIELEPREGMIAPVKKPAPPPPKPAGLPTPTPMEISLPPSAAAAPVLTPPPAPALAPTVAAKAAGAPTPTSAPSGAGDEVPEGTPHEYVRRVAAVYFSKFTPNIPQFFAFLQQSAQTVSKKPLFLRRVLSEAVEPDTDIPSLIGRAEGMKVVAALAVIEGLPDEKVKQLENAFKTAKIDYRVVAPDDLLKRSVAVDILVEVMLLASEL